jgi:hypothetical protein
MLRAATAPQPTNLVVRVRLQPPEYFEGLSGRHSDLQRLGKLTMNDRAVSTSTSMDASPLWRWG